MCVCVCVCVSPHFSCNIFLCYNNGIPFRQIKYIVKKKVFKWIYVYIKKMCGWVGVCVCVCVCYLVALEKKTLFKPDVL